MTVTLCARLVLALLAAPSVGLAPAADAAPSGAPATERETTPAGEEPSKAKALGATPAVPRGEEPSKAKALGATPAVPRDEPSPAAAGEAAREAPPAREDEHPEAPADDAAASAAAEPRSSRRSRGGASPGGARRGLSWSRADEPVPERRFLLGVEGVVMQAPPLRPDIVRFDPRFLGRSASLGGLGLLGRLHLHPRIGLEVGVRSGSVRYAGREDEDGTVVSQDQVMADVGVLLYVLRGDVTQIAFDAGVGGMGTRVVYELDREGTQLFGSGLVRVGADAEFLVNRIAFVLSVRSYGVLTDRDRVRERGALLEGKGLRAPVPALQTLLVASAGIAYRF